MSRVLPILFNGDMVRAILDGRKTTTRRVIMPHNRKKAKEQGYYQKNGLWVDPRIDNGDVMGHIKDYSVSSCWMRYSWYIKKYAPYKPGDILYVRETWNHVPCIDCNMGYSFCIQCTENPVDYDDGNSIEEGCFIYKADYSEPQRICWRPSIHMPKVAARIWLKVTDVRVECLQDIMKDPPGPDNQIVKEGCKYGCDFIAVWENTIKKTEKELYGWDANPWVWVIEFERCEKPE